MPTSTREQRVERILATIRDIPPGMVASYGQVAEIAGIPRGARQVGYALRHLPAGHDVPWHRVVQAGGTIAFEKDSESCREQAARLMMEGVRLRDGKVDMRKHRWQPGLDEILWKPSAAWDE